MRFVHNGPMLFVVCGASLYCHAHVSFGPLFKFEQDKGCRVFFGSTLFGCLCLGASGYHRSPCPPHPDTPPSQVSRKPLSSGASGGSLHGAASLKVDKVLLVLCREGLENCKMKYNRLAFGADP